MRRSADLNCHSLPALTPRALQIFATVLFRLKHCTWLWKENPYYRVMPFFQWKEIIRLSLFRSILWRFMNLFYFSVFPKIITVILSTTNFLVSNLTFIIIILNLGTTQVPTNYLKHERQDSKKRRNIRNGRDDEITKGGGRQKKTT